MKIRINIRGKLMVFSSIILIVSFLFILVLTRIQVANELNGAIILSVMSKLEDYDNQLSISEASLEYEKTIELDNVKNKLATLVESAVSIAEHYRQLEQQGVLSRREAQDVAKSAIRIARFGKDGYFFAFDDNYTALVMSNSASEGSDLKEQKDNKGNLYTQDMLNNTNNSASGLGYTTYWFPKPGATEPSPKLSATAFVEGWNWYIGTGEYIDHIEENLKSHQQMSYERIRENMYDSREANSFGDKFLDDIIRDEEYTRIFKESYPFVFNGDGTFAFYVNEDFVGVRPDLRDSVTGESLIDIFLEKKNGRIEYNFTRAGVEGSHRKIALLKYNEATDMITCFSYYQDDVESKIGSILMTITISMIAAFVFIFLFLFMAITLITKNISRVSSMMKDVSEGEGDLTTGINIKTKDEIGELGDNFNKFIDRLKNLIIDVKSAVESTDGIKMDLAASTEETSTAVEQISANLKSVGGQLDSLESNIASTASAVEQITSNVSSIDNQIVDQASMVEESTAAITEMIASLESVANITANKKVSVENLNSVAVTGRDMLDSTSRSFKGVVDQIQSIQEMTNTINSIADQTNLLSMNAAIEAAHAGDSGKGFAVVADEIRKLAESAGESSRNIADLISGIITSVQVTDDNVSQTVEIFSSISSEIRDTVNAFAEIESSVSELNIGGRQVQEASEQISEVTVSIRNGSNEIKDGTRSILSLTEDVSRISASVSTGMTESLSGAGEIVHAMQDVVGLAQKLSGVVDDLKDKVGQFKTE
ncbi:MAG: methyl-accepting chemotaxis protein [Spirochaetales bacterium]|nr:methyl-accepting chemotaxis protein [Spirochaetales bacterium]